ncbi:MAG: hypothetical protein KAH84_04870 [Thiomargarita sp.]|nr:hypothetical protein [Thiomargarita sp.]
METKTRYTIAISALFLSLNTQRKYHKLVKIENSLVASKLGILFALTTSTYINFKGESIELDDSQLLALQDIFVQHFNVNMATEIHKLAKITDDIEESNLSSDSNQGFIKKIKGFLKIRPKIQESPA